MMKKESEMKKSLKVVMISTVVAASSLLAAVSVADAGWGRQGQCDHSRMYGGPGMMGGKNRPGPGMNRNLDLSAEEAKTLVEARLIMRGNDRLKVGKVTEQDENTYLVDIETVDHSLVRQISVDRNNGLPYGMKGVAQ
jgi:hypothetical protein